MATNETTSAPAPDPYQPSTARTAHSTQPLTPASSPHNDSEHPHHLTPTTVRLVVTQANTLARTRIPDVQGFVTSLLYAIQRYQARSTRVCHSKLQHFSQNPQVPPENLLHSPVGASTTRYALSSDAQTRTRTTIRTSSVRAPRVAALEGRKVCG
jgi:hypothetical protein